MYDTIIIERGHKANTKIMNELHILWYSRIAVLMTNHSSSWNKKILTTTIIGFQIHMISYDTYLRYSMHLLLFNSIL